ncbi:MAG: CBS domain-containing protein [bacterium]
MKITVAEVLEKKGRDVCTTAPGATVYDALKLIADKGIGALVVLDGGEIAGMFSERDYARKVVLQGRWSKDTLVADVMTTSVYHVAPWLTVVECMELMTEKHVRHLPVLDGGKLVGIISIGDVVKTIISEQQTALKQLEGFVDEALKGRPPKS